MEKTTSIFDRLTLPTQNTVTAEDNPAVTNTNTIQSFLNDSKSNPDLTKKREAVIQMLKNKEDDSFIEDTIVNKMSYTGVVEPKKSLLEKVTYTPNTQEEIQGASTFGKVKMVGDNLVGGAYNIIPGLASMGAGLVKGIATDMGKNIGSLAGIVSDEELNEYQEGHNKKTGELLSGLASHYANTYGSVDGFKKAILEDPTSIISDVLTVAGVGLVGKAKLSTVAKTSLEAEKANIINQVKNAGTLEAKSALIKQGIIKSKQIAKQSAKIGKETKAAGNIFKVDPYVAVPAGATKLISKGITKTASAITKGLEDVKVNRATNQVQKGEDILFEAVNPTTKENKSVLKQRVQDLIPYIEKNPLNNTLDKVKSRIDKTKDTALTNMKKYEDEIGVKGSLATNTIIDKLKKKYQKKIGEGFINKEEANIAQNLIDTLNQFGKAIKDADLITIRRAWDKIEKKNKGFMVSAESSSKGDIFGDANKFFREEIKNSNPEYAKFLQDYSKSTTLSDVIGATIERRVGQQKGGYIKRGAQNVGRIAGATGGVPGYLAAEALIQGSEALGSSAVKLTRGKNLLNKGKKTLENDKIKTNQYKNDISNNGGNSTSNSSNGRGAILKSEAKEEKVLTDLKKFFIDNPSATILNTKLETAKYIKNIENLVDLTKLRKEINKSNLKNKQSILKVIDIKIKSLNK